MGPGIDDFLYSKHKAKLLTNKNHHNEGNHDPHPALPGPPRMILQFFSLTF
jgi:hypothetical protein